MIPILPIWNKENLVQSTTFNSNKAVNFGRLQATPDTALVWGALAFTLRFTRFFGTAPLSFKRERNCWRVSVSPAMRVYSCVFIVVLNIILYAAVVKDAIVSPEDSIHMDSDTIFAVWAIDLVIVTIISVYGIVSGPSQMKQLLLYLNEINMIFKNLKCEYVMQKSEKLRCWFIALYVLGVIGVLAGDLARFIVFAVENKKSMTTLWMYTSYYIEALILCFLELQFILIALLSRIAFQCVNEELNALIIDIDLKNSASQYCSKKIRRLSIAYSDICGAMRRVDKSSGLLLLLLVLSFLVHMVVTPYNVITLMIQKEGEFLLQVFWCICHSSKMMMILEPGHRVQQEIAKTQVLVGQLINRVSSPLDPMMDELDIFHKQITFNPVVFAPLGIFTLSRPLIASIFGAVTTYVVILVQFQNMSIK